MTNFLKIDIKTIIIFGLLIVIFLLYKSSTDGKTVTIGGKTYTVIKHQVDTMLVPVKQIVRKKGKDIYHEKIVYVNNNPNIDTVETVKDYFTQIVYKDTLKLQDSLGYITVLDTIYNNGILNRKWESYVNKFIIKDITILKETPKNQFFIGGFSGYNTGLKSIYLGPTIMFKNKKENAINLGIAVGTGKEIIFQGSIYKIIKYNR